MRTILCYGDSNTHGTPPMRALGEARRLAPADRWTGVMRAALGDGVQVIEEGLPGRTTVHDDPIEGAHRNGLSVLPAILHSHKPIDLLLLMLGTNDLKQRFAVPAQDIALGLGRLIEAARAACCVGDVLLICPPAVRERGCLAEMFAGAETRGRGLPAHAERVAAEAGARFLDAGRHVETDSLDGVHLDAAAHAELGRAVAASVRAATGGGP